jgi:hypothetical protein
MSSIRKRPERLGSGNRLRAAAGAEEAVAAAGDAEVAAGAAGAEAAEAVAAAAAAAAGTGAFVPLAEIVSFNCARHPRA